MTAFVVVNPRSAGGRTQYEWDSLARGLKTHFPDFAVAFTRKRGDATVLVRNALSEGHQEVIAVGGDGTINEAANGFFDDDGSRISPDAVLGFISSGTGGDFRKTFHVAAGTEAGLAHLASAEIRAVDVGRLSCLAQDGTPTVRYFVNIGSFGLSGVIVDAVNRARITKLFGGTFAFAFHSILSMAAYRPRAVRLMLDNGFDETLSVSTVAVANGQYFGGGMRVAPTALPDDGQFDVVIMAASSKGRAISGLNRIYSGDHLVDPAVRVVRARRVVAAPLAESQARPVFVETDGESAGTLPATFEVLPSALNLRSFRVVA